MITLILPFIDSLNFRAPLNFSNIFHDNIWIILINLDAYILNQFYHKLIKNNIPLSSLSISFSINAYYKYFK